MYLARKIDNKKISIRLSCTAFNCAFVYIPQNCLVWVLSWLYEDGWYERLSCRYKLIFIWMSQYIRNITTQEIFKGGHLEKSLPVFKNYCLRIHSFICTQPTQLKFSQHWISQILPVAGLESSDSVFSSQSCQRRTFIPVPIASQINLKHTSEVRNPGWSVAYLNSVYSFSWEDLNPIR